MRGKLGHALDMVRQSEGSSVTTVALRTMSSSLVNASSPNASPAEILATRYLHAARHVMQRGLGVAPSSGKPVPKIRVRGFP